MSRPCSDHVAGVELDAGGFAETVARVTGPAGAPAVLVLGGISAHRRLISDGTGPGWWPGVAEPGGALDPDRYRLLSFDFLAEEVDPFPTLGDQAQALLALADAAGLDHFHVVGASYGGNIGLELASRAPERVETLSILAAAGRVHPMAAAWRSIQRDLVHFGLARGDGAGGLDLARRLAMTTYRTPEEFDQRFACPSPGSLDAAGVEAYLASRGAEYAARTSPHRFLALSRSMDSLSLRLDRISAPTSFLAFDSDRLVPPSDIDWTAAQIADASVHYAHSLFGHDGFLKEPDIVNSFLARTLCAATTTRRAAS